MDIFRKDTVSAEFRAFRTKLCGNYAFQQNFHNRKLDEISVICVVEVVINAWDFQS